MKNIKAIQFLKINNIINERRQKHDRLDIFIEQSSMKSGTNNQMPGTSHIKPQDTMISKTIIKNSKHIM